MTPAKRERLEFLTENLSAAHAALSQSADAALTAASEPLSLINLALFLMFDLGDLSREEFIRIQLERPQDSLAARFQEPENRELVQKITSILANARAAQQDEQR